MMELANTDFFDWEELEQIYQQVRTDDLAALRDAARTLFPDRDPHLAEELYTRESGGRAFKQPDGSYLLPAWTFGCRMVREIGIMPDGSVRRY